MAYKVFFIVNDIASIAASGGPLLKAGELTKAWGESWNPAALRDRGEAQAGIATKSYKVASDLGAPLPYAKEVDAIGGLAAKGPGFVADGKTFFAANDVAKNAKLLTDIGGGAGKLGSYTNPGAPHIPSYTAGGGP